MLGTTTKYTMHLITHLQKVPTCRTEGDINVRLVWGIEERRLGNYLGRKSWVGILQKEKRSWKTRKEETPGQEQLGLDCQWLVVTVT